MPLGYQAQRIGEAPKVKTWDQPGWNRGQNCFSEDNEIRDNEFYEGVDIEIIGRASIRLPRRGSEEFGSIAGAENLNGWGIYKDPINDVNLMILQVDGRVYKATTGGIVSEIDNTKTWDTDAKMRGVLLRGYYYFGNGVDYMAKTDGSTITRWNAITAATGLGVVLTGSGSDTSYAFTVTVVTETGETEMVTSVEIMGPGDLDNSNYFTVTFDRKTDSEVKGYNVYKAVSGSTLTLMTFVDQQTSGATISVVDDGTLGRSSIYEAPTFNTTGGVKGNIYGKYANTLFVSGNAEEPDTVFYGGTGANWESFSPSDNGGWIKPGRGDGDKVTAMIGFEDFLFIFKENSIWKFVFSSDGGPSLISVIPQYGTSSPDTVWRMERDIIFLGTDGRYRILGYEPTQLNVIRTADISNRIQPKLDALSKTNPENFFAAFFEQKYILCNGDKAYPYDRRYLAFLGEWTNYSYDNFIVWDQGTGTQKLFGFRSGEGRIDRLLVDGTYDDNGTSIRGSIRFKRVDGKADKNRKTFYFSELKLKDAIGQLNLYTFKDGQTLLDQTSVTYAIGGGIGEYMFDEAMFDEGEEVTENVDSIQILKKEIYEEAYSIYHQLTVNGNAYNHCVIQTASGEFEYGDSNYDDGKTII